MSYDLREMDRKRTESTPEEKYEALRGKPRDFVDRIGRGVEEIVAHGDVGYCGTPEGAKRMMRRYREEVIVSRGLFRQKVAAEAAKRERDRKDAADASAVGHELDREDELMDAREEAIARLRNLATPSLKRCSSLLTEETRAAVELLDDATTRTIKTIRFEHGEVSLIEFWPPVPAIAQLAKILGLNAPIDLNLTPDDVRAALKAVTPEASS